MDNPTIITLSIVAVLILAILVLAALVLSARSFTQLTDVVRLIGLEVVRLAQAIPPVPTISSTETARSTPSVPQADTRITPDNQG